MYLIIPSTEDHAQELAFTMRQVDRDEIWASGHKFPLEALLGGIKGPGEAYTCFYKDEVVCMFGVTKQTLLGREGVPWLLGSDLILDHAEFFLRESLIFMDDWNGKYSVLVNLVDKRNKIAIRWLKWLGFNIFPAIPFGPDKMLFHAFELRN